MTSRRRPLDPHYVTRHEQTERKKRQQGSLKSATVIQAECPFPRKWDAIGLPEGLMVPSAAVREHNAAVARFEDVCAAYRELELELCAAREAHATPELLAVAQELVAVMFADSCPNRGQRLQRCAEQARVAIARAEGRES